MNWELFLAVFAAIMAAKSFTAFFSDDAEKVKRMNMVINLLDDQNAALKRMDDNISTIFLSIDDILSEIKEPRSDVYDDS